MQEPFTKSYNFFTFQVMESLEHAMKRGAPIIAEYLGGAVNCDAYHMTDPRADGLGVSSCIERSLEDAGVSPEEVILSSFRPILLLYVRNSVFIRVIKFGLVSVISHFPFYVVSFYQGPMTPLQAFFFLKKKFNSTS